MNEPDDKILDLALEELLGSEGGDASDVDATLRNIERKRLRNPGRARRLTGRSTAAVAASLVALALTAWLVLGRFGPSREEARLPAVPGQEAPEEDVPRLIGNLSNPDAADRDSAFLALKRKGPDLLGRFREELGRARDPEARARLQDLVDYWTRTVVAVVDDEVLTRDDVNAALPPGLNGQAVPDDLRRAVLRRLVEERVFFQEARRRGLVASDAEILDRLRDKRFPEPRAPGEELNHEKLRTQLSIWNLYVRILAEARADAGSNPFGLDLAEPSNEEIRAWYDAHVTSVVAVDRVDVSWIELPFKGEPDKAAQRALAEALVVKTRALKALARACVELGVKEHVWVGAVTPETRLLGPFGEATRKSFFDGSFAVGEVRIEELSASVVVVHLYNRTERAYEPFEKARPAIRSLLENQEREANRRRMREGLLRQSRIYPADLFKDP